ncbi:hypothetical protein K491DRAFT_754749 [Lophiostoma macrostomum CBS 122681]|uniref:Uncharacterized protein n=1 Tax=Lophiostoma macrostomum CBS 122681 TaxID=1314788 RepID=A0A6A6TP91_9PLEO|nr:hypothetical protein K491DRAFT_754749 [Lophiostoma macrostomum CBS 122681]
MGSIYQEATEVLIWLGLEPALDHIFDFAQKIRRCIGPLPPTEPLGNYVGPSAALSEIVDRDGSKVDHSIEAFCSHRYWKRTWIAQEILLAYYIRVTNGSRMFDPDIDTQNFPDRGESIVIWYFQERNRRRGRILSLMPDLILLFWDADCTDERDRVYALLALADDRAFVNKPFEADYSESPANLFWRTSHHYHLWDRPLVLSKLYSALNLTNTALDIISQQPFARNRPIMLTITSSQMNVSFSIEHSGPLDQESVVVKVRCPNCDMGIDIKKIDEVPRRGIMVHASLYHPMHHAIFFEDSNGRWHSLLVTSDPEMKARSAQVHGIELVALSDGQTIDLDRLPALVEHLNLVGSLVRLPSDYPVEVVKAWTGISS